MSAKDFVESSVFDNCKQHAVDTLEEIWIRFLKEDLKAFLEYVNLLLSIKSIKKYCYLKKKELYFAMSDLGLQLLLQCFLK